MKSINPRIQRLKELMELEERRADLQSQLDQLIDQMTALKNALFEETSSPAAKASSVPASRPAAAAAPAPRGRRRGRTPRGELKSQILSALTAAGSKGVRVTDLAQALGIKPVNIHSWFHSAMARYSQIKKMDRGQYRLDGQLPGSGSGSTASSPARSAKAAVSGPAKAGRRGRGGSRRGELSRRILEELSSAGSQGVNVRDLSSKVGAPYKNIYIWFATTGKKNPKVKKIAPATYKLVS